MTIPSSSPAPRHDRALILGGGGSTGNAWLIGIVAGLTEAGLDVTDADLVVGTSAGSTAAAQLTGARPSELLAAVLDAPPAPPRALGARPASPTGPSRPPNPTGLEALPRIIDASTDPADFRRRLGAAAIERDAGSDASAQRRWRATVAMRLPHPEWPDRDVRITAIDAESGEPAVFDRTSGVRLVDAVAASCSNGFGVGPYRIGDRRYLDGGYRRNENADLAAGCARVLVLSPFGGRSLHPEGWGMQLAAQIDELRAGGSAVETLAPDADAEHLFGPNAMNLALRPTAARVAYEQGLASAARLAGFWR